MEKMFGFVDDSTLEVDDWITDDLEVEDDREE